MEQTFWFATGIENSDPTIQNGKLRVDEMERCDHYKRWREDFDLIEELKIHFLRYGVPLHKIFIGPGKYDWEFRRRNLLRSEAPRHYSHRRSLPLRCAGLDRQFSKSGFSGIVCGIRPRVRQAF